MGVALSQLPILLVLVLLLRPLPLLTTTIMFLESVQCVYRFFLGVGAGGVYPLSASVAAEASSKVCHRIKFLLCRVVSCRGNATDPPTLVAHT